MTIKTGVPNENFLNNYDRIFGKKVTVSNEKGCCGSCLSKNGATQQKDGSDQHSCNTGTSHDSLEDVSLPLSEVLK